MQSFFRRRAMNLLFPFAVTAATIVATLMVSAAIDPATPPQLSAGLILVTTMLGAAILEHWLLVLPLPATALWKWAMRSPDAGAIAPVAKPSEDTLLHAR